MEEIIGMIASEIIRNYGITKKNMSAVLEGGSVYEDAVWRVEQRRKQLFGKGLIACADKVMDSIRNMVKDEESGV